MGQSSCLSVSVSVSVFLLSIYVYIYTYLYILGKRISGILRKCLCHMESSLIKASDKVRSHNVFRIQSWNFLPSSFLQCVIKGIDQHRCKCTLWLFTDTISFFAFLRFQIILSLKSYFPHGYIFIQMDSIHYLKTYFAALGLNPKPRACQADILPLSPSPACIAFDPPSLYYGSLYFLQPLFAQFIWQVLLLLLVHSFSLLYSFVVSQF